MHIGSAIDLLAAVSGLTEVRDVIAAMRAADSAGSASRGPLDLAPNVELRRTIHPEPRFEPRRVIHPTPRFEPRPILHPTPRYESRRLAADEVAPPPQLVVTRPTTEMPLQPPWKTAPWQMPLQIAPKVKIPPPHPDICHKGRLLDFFI